MTTEPTPRPEWADVTIPEDIRRARTIAALLEEDNARLTAQNEQLQSSLGTALDTIKSADGALDAFPGALDAFADALNALVDAVAGLDRIVLAATDVANRSAATS